MGSRPCRACRRPSGNLQTPQDAWPEHSGAAVHPLEAYVRAGVSVYATAGELPLPGPGSLEKASITPFRCSIRGERGPPGYAWLCIAWPRETR